jgi:hypothetical protein
MAEPPKCPTSHCPDKRKAILPAGPRRHDKDRKTRYKCQTCGQEITQRTASAFKLTQYPAMCVQRGRHREAPNRHIGCSVGSPASAFLVDGTVEFSDITSVTASITPSEYASY